MSSPKAPVVQCVGDATMAEFLPEDLRRRDWPFAFVPVPEPRSAARIVERINCAGAPAILIGWGTPPLPDDLPQQAPSLRYVCNLTGALRGMLSRRAIESGLLVSNWGTSISRTIAEHALTLALASLRRMGQWRALHTADGWRGALPPRSLFGRRIGIHGFGAIVRELLKLLAPFGCDVAAYSPGVPPALFAEHGVRQARSLDELFAGSDVLFELEALNELSQGSVTRRVLELLPRDAVFINCGRGKVVDEAALGELAAAGRITVGLDVFAREPVPADSPLRHTEHAILTPHIAGPTPDRRRDAGLLAMENLARFFRGERPLALVGLTEYDRIT